MANYKKLEYITNGINAAKKIRSIKNTSSNTRGSEDKDTISMINRVLEIIADYSPPEQKNLLASNIQKGALYGNTYRDLKSHIKKVQNTRSTNPEGIVRTLDIIKPIVDKDKRRMIEKILRVYEALNS